MTSFRLLVLALLLGVAAPSCTRSPPQPEIVTVPCGTERVLGKIGRSREARICLWEHYRKGTSGSLVSTAQGADASLTYTLRVVSPGVVEVRLDSYDKTRSPMRSSSSHTCTGLRRVEKAGAAPGLVVTGCPAGGNPEIDLP